MSGIDIFFTFIIVILICGFLAFQTLVMRVKEIQIIGMNISAIQQ